MKTEIEKLEEFVEDGDLERLENILNEFNIFKTLDLIKQEIKHSKFLSWLLNPQENHELSDYFLRLFLKKVCSKVKTLRNRELSIITIDSWDFSETEILTEWKGIDILIKDEKNKFICLIENKIETKEHSNQLSRYKETIDKEFPKFMKFYLYLTPEGDNPSDQDYISLKYSEVNEIIKALLNAKGESINENIRLLISNYNKILERFIVPDSEISELCKKIYNKHREALELIFEYKPDTQSAIFDVLTDIIKTNNDLILDDSTKSYVRFIPKILDDKIEKKGGEWTKTKRILLFEFKNASDSLKLDLVIGPGDQLIRQKLHKIAQDNTNIFKRTNLYPKFTTIYTKDFLSKRDLENIPLEDLEKKIKERFDKFLNDDMKKLLHCFKP